MTGGASRRLQGARARAPYMAAGTTLKLGVRPGRRPILAGISSFQTHLAGVPFSMSFDHKTPSSPVKIAEALPSPFGNELDCSQGAPQNSLPGPGNVHRRRRSTKGTMPAIIKRSASTPNVRGLASTDSVGTSLADKRRNKLGYHRTSVACGECPVQLWFDAQAVAWPARA